MVWRINESTSIRVTNGGVYIDGETTTVAQSVWVVDFFISINNLAPSLLTLELARHLLVTYADSPPPVSLVSLFDMQHKNTYNIITKCIYDWGWLLEPVRLNLGETLIVMSLYTKRLNRLRTLSKHAEQFSGEDLLMVLCFSKRSFAHLECLFAATRSRRLFAQTIKKNANLLLDIRNGDVGLSRCANFELKLKKILLAPHTIFSLWDMNDFVFNIVNRFKKYGIIYSI